LNGLGEKKWLNGDDNDMPSVELDDPDSFRRGEVRYKMQLASS